MIFLASTCNLLCVSKCMKQPVTTFGSAQRQVVPSLVTPLNLLYIVPQNTPNMVYLQSTQSRWCKRGYSGGKPKAGHIQWWNHDSDSMYIPGSDTSLNSSSDHSKNHASFNFQATFLAYPLKDRHFIITATRHKFKVRRVQARHLINGRSFKGLNLGNRFHYTARLQTPPSSNKSKSTLFLRVALGWTAGYSVHVAQKKGIIFCKARASTRLAGVKDATGGLNEDPPFDWKKFFALLIPHIWHLIAAVVGSFIVAALNIQIPQVLGSMVNIMASVASGQGTATFANDIKGPALKLIRLYISQAVFTFGYIYLLSSIGERVAAQLRKELFAAILRQDIKFFDKHRTGEIVNRLTTDVQDFKSSFKLCISQGLRSVTQIIGCAVSLMFISPQMTAAMMLVMPTTVIVGTLLGSVLRRFSREAQAQIAQSTCVCEEAISNIRTVRAFAMESQEQELFTRETDSACVLQERLGMGIGMFQGGTNLFLNCIVLGTLWSGGRLMANQQLAAGDLMAFLVASQTIQRSVAQISLLFGQMVRGLAAGARVFEYINMEPTVPLKGGKRIPYHCLVGDVSFENVVFSYPTREGQTVLKDFTLKIPAGKMVAIVGASGGGKSTIAALLERFYEVDSGRITLDTFDIKKLDPSWLRGRAIGFINQEPVLFATSIMENIRYGRPNATDQEVIAAARKANAHGFIQSFPEGYNTIVGERGVTVSGGQKQRIAIARALLKDPSILILDEATSALDTESERIVQAALDQVVRGRTVLVIAHRLSTIRNADIIAVVSNGRVVELGNDSSLRRKRGLYWTLVQQQERLELEEATAKTAAESGKESSANESESAKSS